MKIKEGFVLREVMGKKVVIAVGDASLTFRGMVQLNETAAEIWDHISKGCAKEEIVDAMLEKYDVPRQRLEEDVERSISLFLENGMIEL
ncbi:MAG: PqqD family protein [Clostridia bacterium]|nr:PqqD family protein [Clostridia bacterium]